MEVEPIRTIKEIEKLKRRLKNDGKLKELVLVVIGLNSGLRISDILNLKWIDFLDSNQNFKPGIIVNEQKTGKTKKFAINENIKQVLKSLIKEDKVIDLNDYLFVSRSNNAQGKVWTRQYCHTFIKQYARLSGIKYNVGTHTLRKTFGYFAYKNGVDIALLQHLLNHSAPNITLKYIGITQDRVDDVYLNIVSL